MEENTLATLHKKMQMDELQQTLESLWTVCPTVAYDPLDRFISGVGPTGTHQMPNGPTGTEVRIRFGGEGNYRSRSGKFY